MASASPPPFRRGRFAPSTTGRIHPGTMLAGLLCWLDARAVGAEVVLRLEDLDIARTKEGYVDAMREDLAWFGLEWDDVSRQSCVGVLRQSPCDYDSPAEYETSAGSFKSLGTTGTSFFL